jgi:hypothetical protein
LNPNSTFLLKCAPNYQLPSPLADKVNPCYIELYKETVPFVLVGRTSILLEDGFFHMTKKEVLQVILDFGAHLSPYETIREE